MWNKQLPRRQRHTTLLTLWDWRGPGYIKAVLKVRTCLLKKLPLTLKVTRHREELNMPLVQTALRGREAVQQMSAVVGTRDSKVTISSQGRKHCRSQASQTYKESLGSDHAGPTQSTNHSGKLLHFISQRELLHAGPLAMSVATQCLPMNTLPTCGTVHDPLV